MKKYSLLFFMAIALLNCTNAQQVIR